MTKLERLRARHEALGRQVKAEEQAQIAARARGVFRTLADNPELPVLDILDQALGGTDLLDSDRAPDFVERLEEITATHGA